MNRIELTSEYIINHREYIEGYILNIISNIEYESKLGRKIAYVIEDDMIEIFKEYLNNELKNIVRSGELIPKHTKTLEDLSYNNILFDTKTSNEKYDGGKDLISGNTLLRNLDKTIFYIICLYTEIGDSYIFNRVIIRHYKELNFDKFYYNNGGIQYTNKAIKDDYKMKTKEEIKSMIIKKTIISNNKKMRKLTLENDRLTKLISN